MVNFRQNYLFNIGEKKNQSYNIFLRIQLLRFKFILSNGAP